MTLFKNLPVLAFETPEALRTWLDRHHAEAPGFWLQIYKKGSGKLTVTYAEALDEALCYGWIDSTKNAYDAESFLQRFTPRKPRSVWSQVNREHVARLIEAGQMQAAGLRVIEDAKRNGHWDAAYAPASRATVPPDLQARLDAAPEAKAFFETLTQANRYAILYRLQSAKKPETRVKRLEWALDLLQRQETVY